METSALERPDVIDDLGTYVGTGRSGDPRALLSDSRDAESLGLRRIWCSERYDLKESGSLMSAILASTSSIEVGTGILAVGSRHPLMTAAMGAPLQAIYSSRFNLVGHVTDPSWSSIMFLSCALVTDIGGQLSHTAVVARELGIPCVVDTKIATTALRTGDLCRINGSTGTIEILQRAGEAPT